LPSRRLGWPAEKLGQGRKSLEGTRRGEKAGSGAIETSQVDVKGKIVEFAWWTKKEGYADATIKMNALIAASGKGWWPYFNC